MQQVETIFELVKNFFISTYTGVFGLGLLFLVLFPAIFFIFQLARDGFAKTFERKAITGSLASLTIYILNFMFIPLTYFGVDIVRDGYAALNIPHLDPSIWLALPAVVVAMIGVITHDFADYWNHRAMHCSWIWPIHAIHHSDESVNGYTTFRIHFLEAAFMKSSYIIILSWLGIPAEAATVGVFFLLLHNIYVHFDLDWDHGPLQYLIASPRFHRWHHANEPEAYGKNLANVIPLFDVMFGTYYNPGKCDKKMGADGVPHDDVAKLILFPFAEWGRIIKRAFVKKTEKKPFVEPAE